MANLYPFHGHSPQIDPGAFVQIRQRLSAM